MLSHLPKHTTRLQFQQVAGGRCPRLNIETLNPQLTVTFRLKDVLCFRVAVPEAQEYSTLPGHSPGLGMTQPQHAFQLPHIFPVVLRFSEPHRSGCTVSISCLWTGPSFILIPHLSH